ncbi:MAG: MFS transporter [Chloroflexi bacterium]|nr:MFS transporter [Chloroflexota bacterium]
MTAVPRAWTQDLAPNRNIAVFHLLTIVMSCVFISGNWIFYWTRFMTYGQLGVVDASAFAFGLLMEVPTGAIADMIGKKRTMLAAMLCQAAGILLMASTEGPTQLVAGFLLMQTGWAFYSGATEALAYDSLRERGQEGSFERILALNHRLSIITIVISTLLGGLLYNVHYRLPHYAWGLAFVAGFAVALLLREARVEHESSASFPVIQEKQPGWREYLSAYGQQLGAGFRQLMQPALRPYVPLIFGVLGVYFLYSFGLISPAMATGFGFMADGQAVVFALLGTVAALAVGFLPALRRRFSDRSGLALLGLLLALGFVGGALPLGVWGFGALLCIRLAGALANPWISVVVNQQIPSRYRATTLSTIALLVKIPYVASAVIAGAMVEAGTFWLFNLLVAAGTLLLVGASLLAFRARPMSPSS